MNVELRVIRCRQLPGLILSGDIQAHELSGSFDNITRSSCAVQTMPIVQCIQDDHPAVEIKGRRRASLGV